MDYLFDLKGTGRVSTFSIGMQEVRLFQERSKEVKRKVG